ncbi:MAG TPA: addiction module protein [Thermoguttaceae bacterium]|nr:addiction module protein [Thermoguttaceae bacterium]
MNATVQKLLEDALRLPDTERAELAASLIDSLDEHVDDNVPEAWDSEILRRLAELDRGEVKPVPWSEARRIITGSHNESADR